MTKTEHFTGQEKNYSLVLVIYKIMWHILIFRRRVYFYSYPNIHRSMTVIPFLNDPWDFWTIKNKLGTTASYWTALQSIVILLFKRAEPSGMLNLHNSCILIMGKFKIFVTFKLHLLCVFIYLNKHALKDFSTNLSHLFVTTYTKRYTFCKKNPHILVSTGD